VASDAGAAIDSATMSTNERDAGVELMNTGTLAEFEVVRTHVEPAPDGETKFVRIEMQLGGDEAGDGEDQVEWVGFGFMFLLAVMSFHDAGPRGYSENEFVDEDGFTVGDFFEGLRFVRGELHLDVDYVRGRCMKTNIIVRRDGWVVVETRGRSDVALRWVERIQGKKLAQRAS
jgi:hypothetical protein